MGRFNKAVTWVKLSELRAPYQLKRWFETLPFVVSERRVGSKRVESGRNEQNSEDTITGYYGNKTTITRLVTWSTAGRLPWTNNRPDNVDSTGVTILVILSLPLLRFSSLAFLGNIQKKFLRRAESLPRESHM